MALIIKTNGTKIPTEPKNGTDFKLEELQAIVGGYIEMIPANDPDYILVINEEGKLNNLPVNESATETCKEYLQYQDYIVGDALFCKRNQIN